MPREETRKIEQKFFKCNYCRFENINEQTTTTHEKECDYRRMVITSYQMSDKNGYVGELATNIVWKLLKDHNIDSDSGLHDNHYLYVIGPASFHEAKDIMTADGFVEEAKLVAFSMVEQALELLAKHRKDEFVTKKE